MKKIIFFSILFVSFITTIIYYNFFTLEEEIAEAIVEIESYDLEKLISNNYIRFKVKHKSNSLNQYDNKCKEKPFICLETDKDSVVVNDYAVNNKDLCTLSIKRGCSERSKKLSGFYVPKEHVKTIDNGLKSSSDRKMKISISEAGKLYVKNFYINGLDWEKYIWKIKEEFMHRKDKKRRGSR